jgi:hypothetical protein
MRLVRFPSERRHFSPSVRIQAWSVWESLEFVLNGLVFVLIGLQLSSIRASIREYDLSTLSAASHFCWRKRVLTRQQTQAPRKTRPVSHKSIIGPLYSKADAVEGDSYRIK